MQPEHLIVLIFIVYTITLHELAHAYAATYFGDPTPGLHGRLTFNPLVQLHWVYSVAMPIFFYFIYGWPFGFAFCPIDPSRFKNPLRDRALVALAGPLVNLGIAALCLTLLWVPAIAPPDMRSTAILFGTGVFSVILGVFNLVPIPGLDGYDILRPALPLNVRNFLDGLRQGFLPFLLIFVFSFYIWSYFLWPAIGFYFSLLPPHVNGWEYFQRFQF